MALIVEPLDYVPVVSAGAPLVYRSPQPPRVVGDRSFGDPDLLGDRGAREPFAEQPLDLVSRAHVGQRRELIVRLSFLTAD